MMRSKLRKIQLFLIMIAALLVGIGASKKTITIKGSDTPVILAQRWAETYMKKHPDVVIQVTVGGSGTGISAPTNGTTGCDSCSGGGDTGRTP